MVLDEDDLIRRVERWQSADAAGRDDEADAALQAVFGDAMPRPHVPLEFTASTMAAIAAAAAADARRARRAKRIAAWGGAAAAVAAIWFGFGPIVSALSRTLAFGLDLLVGFVVWLASGSGRDMWSVLANLGRAAAAFASDPSVSMVILALQGIAIAALVALHRLLGSETEYSE
jgi:hypothetical protein